MRELLILPSRAIASFIDAQAETIRGNLWFDVISGFLDEEIRPDVNIEMLGVQTLVDAPDPFQRCIHAIGALDYSLSRDFSVMERFHVEIAQSSPALDNELTRHLALSAPLRRRYFESAASAWTVLRAGTLSYPSLRQFQAQQWAADPSLRR